MSLISNRGLASVVTAVLLFGVLPSFGQTNQDRETAVPISPGPTSIGFEDPDDISNLLDYRLPDWGYRTWDLAFDLGGRASESYAGDEARIVNNSFATGLATGLTSYRESEGRTWSLEALLDGNYSRSHHGSYVEETSRHSLDGSALLTGDYRRYLGEGPVFLSGGGGLGRVYEEDVSEDRNTGMEDRRFHVRDDLAASVGAGIGRVRDVTPLIRAQRLSERLKSLGRPPLTGAQVREVAEVLAREHGYRVVFDRPDKSFWRDVLAPMLEGQAPLSPYEIFYLADILAEDIGPRSQGTVLGASLGYRETPQSFNGSKSNLTSRFARATLTWVRNLSLHHQLHAIGSVNWNDYGSGLNHEQVSISLDLKHLWNVADRYRWDNAIGLSRYYFETPRGDARDITRTVSAALSSEFRVFLEDDLALLVSLRGSGNQREGTTSSPEERDFFSKYWQWTYGIGLEYYLDRFLY